MKKFVIIILTLLLSIFATGCSKDSKSKSSEDWSSNFVVWNKNMYNFTNETVLDVEESIGQVEKYSDNENIKTSKVFSNIYPEGTKIYKIKDISTDIAIAVGINDKYIKGSNSEKYGSN
ncbi:hypothetical protein [Paenibacillus nasutitermitis]|uniref:Uncharacterized protein n=1 Tax=Paenibacillus nasutitermitis TaxID=1652958 RepID=A0A916ZIS9_9BACL|nr:hypothetical protein [Paenibacillus nasutitermitis]GGE00086.1 hypothetical protein GCM10010911_68830 [Paenibacillus nasutitermitis]